MTSHEQSQLQRWRSIERSASGVISMFYVLIFGVAAMTFGPALSGPLPFVVSFVMFLTGTASLLILIIALHQMRVVRRDALERIAQLAKNGVTP